MFNSFNVQYLQRLAAELKAEPCASGEIEVVRDGSRFKIYLFPASEGGMYVPGYFQIRIEMPPPSWSFQVRRNDLLDRIAEHIFFKQDFQVGDYNFDSELFITAENQMWAKKFFGKQVVRSGIIDLLSNGFHRIFSKDGELLAIKYVKSSDDCPSVELINRAVDIMRQIHSNCSAR